MEEEDQLTLPPILIQRRELEGWKRGRGVARSRGRIPCAQRLSFWRQIVLNNCAIADEVGVSRMTVLTWRKRFAAQRFYGLDDEPRCGAPREIGDDKIADVVTKTLETMPSHATHWSTRSMVKASPSK